MRHITKFALVSLLVATSSVGSAQARAEAAVESSRIQAPKLGIASTKSERLPSHKTLAGGGELALKADSAGGLPHGVIGGGIGAVLGGGLGYLRVGMYCETNNCDATRSVLTGAAIGAGVGMVLEYFVRHGQRFTSPATHRNSSTGKKGETPEEKGSPRH